MFDWIKANTNLFKVSDLQLMVEVGDITQAQYNSIYKFASDYNADSNK